MKRLRMSSLVLVLLGILACSGGGSSVAPTSAPTGLPTPTPTTTPTPTPTGPIPGDVIWTSDLSTNPLLGNTLKGITWLQPGPDGKNCIQVELPSTSTLSNYTTSFPFDITPYRGMQILFEVTFKAENVTTPDHTWKGIVCELSNESATAGTQFASYTNAWGTWDWKTFQGGMNIPVDAANGKIYVGLQGCTGKAWITDWKIRMVRKAPTRPAVDPQWKPTRSPAMRGVMHSGAAYGAYVANNLKDLSKWKVNIVRWIMGTDQATAADPKLYDAWLDGRLVDLAKALVDAKTSGIKLTVDLHSAPGGRRADGSNVMFYDAASQDHFIAVWQKIATRFKGNASIYAYDLVNEPSQSGFVPAGLQDWRNLQIKAAKAIRAIDATTPICIAVDGYDEPNYFDWMDPVDVPGIIYTVHMYRPMEFTHQGVTDVWDPSGNYPKVKYPGTLNGKPFTKDTLRTYLKPVRDFQLANKVPIYVGEFSAIRWAEGAATYLEDLTSLYEEYGWDWSYHAFREWPGWSLEAENLPYPATRNDYVPATTTDRMLKIRYWFEQNTSAY